jgi:23S rRNA pseudouridine2605 synthase
MYSSTIFLFLAVTVTRLIRISYGDYTLNTIPPGMAVEMPYIPIEAQKGRGSLVPKKKSTRPEPTTSDVKWISAP